MGKGHLFFARWERLPERSCLRHAADKAPLEGLLILRCAIYDPLEGLQTSKIGLSEMGV